jgi:hypothetical protein
MRNRPPLAAPLLITLILTVAVLWRALYAVASVIVDHYGLLGTLVAYGACYAIRVIIDHGRGGARQDSRRLLNAAAPLTGRP